MLLAIFWEHSGAWGRTLDDGLSEEGAKVVDTLVGMDDFSAKFMANAASSHFRRWTLWFQQTQGYIAVP